MSLYKLLKLSDFQRVGQEIQRACVGIVRGSIEYSRRGTARVFWSFLGQCGASHAKKDREVELTN